MKNKKGNGKKSGDDDALYKKDLIFWLAQRRRISLSSFSRIPPLKTCGFRLRQRKEAVTLSNSIGQATPKSDPSKKRQSDSRAGNLRRRNFNLSLLQSGKKNSL